MGRIKRAGYIFEFWVGDHFPKHVHVFKDGKFVCKIRLKDMTLMEGVAGKKIITTLRDLVKEGKIL
jgi:hypothetical protein